MKTKSKRYIWYTLESGMRKKSYTSKAKAVKNVLASFKAFIYSRRPEGGARYCVGKPWRTKKAVIYKLASVLAAKKPLRIDLEGKAYRFTGTRLWGIAGRIGFFGIGREELL